MTAKVGIVEREEAVIAMQWNNKHFSAAIDTGTKMANAVLSMRTFVAMVQSVQ
jgi:hypothetical protein